jgi:hypothetical protein
LSISRWIFRCECRGKAAPNVKVSKRRNCKVHIGLHLHRDKRYYFALQHASLEVHSHTLAPPKDPTIIRLRSDMPTEMEEFCIELMGSNVDLPAVRRLLINVRPRAVFIGFA